MTSYRCDLIYSLANPFNYGAVTPPISYIVINNSVNCIATPPTTMHNYSHPPTPSAVVIRHHHQQQQHQHQHQHQQQQ